MRFDYYEPATISECVEMLTYYGPEAHLLAGGTDLVVKIRLRLVRPRVVISLGSLEELKKLERKNDGSLEIGAMKTLREIEQSNALAKDFDLIRQGAGCVSSMQVRNVATLGGNSCNASPSADTVPGLIAADAVTRIVGPGRERLLPLEEFFVAPGKTTLQTGEMLAGFQVPALPPSTGAVYKKFALRGEVDIAIVGVAARLTLDESQRVKQARIVLGAVAPTPLRARGAEEVLFRRYPSDELFMEAARVVAEDSRPITDQRATAQYRKEMIKVWTRHALQEAFQKACGS
ncbi:MAG: xanthine dehydrogenase family protein subunit M [Deltaproteobacteria bacterium]|nr:xanthine dehydrogenase family protein subunit M [Deltaproteobacteria bacterium]